MYYLVTTKHDDHILWCMLSVYTSPQKQEITKLTPKQLKGSPLHLSERDGGERDLASSSQGRRWLKVSRLQILFRELEYSNQSDKVHIDVVWRRLPGDVVTEQSGSSASIVAASDAAEWFLASLGTDVDWVKTRSGTCYSTVLHFTQECLFTSNTTVTLEAETLKFDSSVPYPCKIEQMENYWSAGKQEFVRIWTRAATVIFVLGGGDQPNLKFNLFSLQIDQPCSKLDAYGLLAC